MKGTIFDVKRFAVHDGPGIRTTLFLKGCPLHCAWCQNPEGIRSDINIMYLPGVCMHCGRCFKVCPVNALSKGRKGEPFVRIDAERCVLSGECVETCPTGALRFNGRDVDTQEVVDALLADRLFYDISGGGITLSGGDPLFQQEFTRDILSSCKRAVVHTAIETAAFVAKDVLASFLDLVDLFIVDVKLFEERAHKKWTGVSNKLILENVKYLLLQDVDVLIRTPLIPGITATENNLRSIARFLSGIRKGVPYEMINFNPLAENKYRVMGGGDTKLGELKPLTEEEFEKFETYVLEEGVRLVKEHKLMTRRCMEENE